MANQPFYPDREGDQQSQRQGDSGFTFLATDTASPHTDWPGDDPR